MTPKWLKLVKAWGRRGRSGLTPEFLCAACGMQPEDLLYQLYMRGHFVGYCHHIMAPLISVRSVGGGDGFYISRSGIQHLQDWLGVEKPRQLPNTEGYWLLMSYTHAQLANGTPSRRREGWAVPTSNHPFSSEEKRFIKKVLGHKPPEILGVSDTGRIEYAKRVKGGG